MKNADGIKGSMMRSVALGIALACGSGAAQAQSGLQAGWTEQSMTAFAQGCADAIVEPARRDYEAAARQAGNRASKPFPADAVRDSVQPMCQCIGRRVAGRWPLAEAESLGWSAVMPLIQEALGGGQCKPEGILAKMFEQMRR